MSAATIIEQLDALIKLHENLNKLAVQKTEVIKKGDMEKLNKLLIEEQKYVKAIQQVENKRQLSVERSFQHASKQTSLLDIIEAASPSEQKTLNEQRNQLLQIIAELKNTNNLNQQLLYHSLQYVNITLDMLRPQETNLNYGQPTATNQRQISRGMFDSRA